MSNRSGFVFVSALFLSFAAHAADAASALKKLEEARSNLGKAVERIKADPPSNADLDAAHAAVEALKEAVDAGAEHEQSDLDYAKAALAARKELRTQRDYVDQRRANVKIFDARRAIDAAMKTLNENAAKLKDKEPAPAVFTDVRANAAAVKKLSDEARPFGKQDPKFAAFLGDTDGTVAKHLAAADEKETLIAVDKQRAAVEELRAALKSAAGAIGKDATDDQFKAVDTAASALTKKLDEGKALEAKNKAYAGDAGKVRAELAASKKKVDELWTATGLQRLKAEIEPQFKDLQAAAKPLRGKPSAEQLAEARTAAIVVRKLVEKFQPEAERSQAFGQYVDQVKKTLVEVETTLEQKSLLAAQADVGIAQRNVEKKSPSDEQFQLLATSITVLEKTLQTVHTKEPSMAKVVGESEWVIKEAKKTMEKRRLEVDIERQTAKVEEARKLAGEAMGQLNAASFTKDQVQAAESSIKLIGTVLEQGTPLTEKDKNYKYYDGEVKKRVAELNDKLAAKKIQLAASDARTVLVEAVATAKAKLDTAKAPEGKDSDLEAAITAVDAIGKGLEAQAGLEKQDRGYAAQAEKTRNELFKLTDTLEFTKLARELRKKTGEALAVGNAAVDQGSANKDLRGRKKHYEKGLTEFRSCQSEGLQLTKMLPALAKLPVLVEGKPMNPREVMELCGVRAAATELLMKEVAPLIKFEDGPKKSYEAGKALLDKSKKSEALAQFNECIATGIILGNDYSDMKTRKFDVAGGAMTLDEIVAFCQNQRKALMANK